MEKNNLRFFGFVVLIVGILILGFVMAVAGPTNVIFWGNSTANYDNDGVFTVNWSDDGDANNYTIYIYVDDVFFTSATNNSATGYSFTNTTDANYTFTIEEGNDTTLANSTNVSMVVDTTTPTLSYTTGTPADDTAADRTWIFVNVTSSDENNDSIVFSLYNSTGLVFQNITDAKTMNWTGLPNAVYYFNVTANDSATNSNLATTRTFYLDGTAPSSVTLTLSSSSRTSLTVSISISDALSGVGSSCTADRSGASISGTGTTQTLTETGLSCGNSYSYVVTCTDKAGNSKSSSSTSFTTSGCGGAALPQPPKKIHSWTKITPGAATIMKDFDKEFGIKEIQITVNNPAQDVKITVTKHNDTPAEVTKEKSGKVYKYLQIETENLADKLDKGIVTIQVEKSWASNNNLDKDRIAMFKFDGNKWNELTTNYKTEDNDYYYYDVEVDSFSYFAISEKAKITKKEIIEKIEEGKTWLWILVILIVVGLIIWFKTKGKKK